MTLRRFAAMMGLALVLGYLVILQLDAVWQFTIDDMYITLRYAKNWVTHGQLGWNVGEPPVEGYSNFSFLLVAAAILQGGGDPVIGLKLLGVGGLLLTVLAVYCLSRFWFGRGLSLIPCGWLLMYRGQILWSVGGLETTLYQALLAFGLYYLLRTVGYTPLLQTRKAKIVSGAIPAALLFAIASMTRPEAPAVILPFYALACLDSWRQGAPLFRRPCRSLMLYMALFLPYFIWRWHHYGLLFPNPVYCKGIASPWFNLDVQYLRFVWPFLLVASYAALTQRRQGLPWYFLLPSAIYLLLLIQADSVVAFANRLFLPAFALLLPLSLQGVSEFIRMIFPNSDKAVYTAAMAMASFLMAFFFIPTMSLSQYRQFTENPVAGEHLRMNVVQWLAREVPADSRVVLGDSGLIPYQSPLHFIDSFCLNNKAMVLLPQASRNQQFCQTILHQKPEVVILTSLLEHNKPIYMPVDQCLQKQLKADSDYTLRRVFSTSSHDAVYRYEIYGLK